jgi:hypothetical protein
MYYVMQRLGHKNIKKYRDVRPTGERRYSKEVQGVRSNHTSKFNTSKCLQTYRKPRWAEPRIKGYSLMRKYLNVE